MPAIDHHPTLDDLRREHGFAEWTEDDVAAHYPSLRSSGGRVDWPVLHARDHEREPMPHLSDAE